MAKFVNTILISLGVFFLSYTWLTYLTQNKLLAAAAAGAVCVIFAFVAVKYFPLRTKKYKRGEDKKILAALENRLIFDADTRGVFMRIFEARGFEAVEQAVNAFLVRKNAGNAAADSGGKAAADDAENGGATLVCIHFAFNAFSRQSFAEAVKLAKKAEAKKMVLICNKCENLQSVESFAPCAVKLAGMDEVRELLEGAGVEMPAATGARRARNFARLAEIALVAARSKFYFWSAVMLCALSFVSYFPVYTLTLATVSMLLAIYSRFNRRFNNKVSKNWLTF